MVHKLQAFKTHVEHNSQKAIKIIRVDNENRYVDYKLRDFCRLEGIDLQNPTLFSMHKRDVAATRIHILNTIVSCMIKEKSLDPSLEVKAISSASSSSHRQEDTF